MTDDVIHSTQYYILNIILGWVYDIISHLICIFYTFLTARPWAEHSSCSTLGLFFIFFIFFIFYFFTQISTRPTFNYAICNVYLPNLVSSGSTEILDYKITPNLHVAKKSLQNPDIEAIYHFSVNSYLISAVLKSIRWQSSFIILKFQRNRTKPELIIIRFFFCHLASLLESTKESHAWSSENHCLQTLYYSAKQNKLLKVKNDHRSKFSNLSNWKEEAWKNQASSFELLKLENLLRWSFFTFIYNCSSYVNYFI